MDARRRRAVIDAIHRRLERQIGSDGLARLHRARVGVVGTGLLGGEHLHHLAMLQVPTLLVDAGRVELPNLGNQRLPASAVGEPKALVRSAQMHALNPSCAVRAFHARVEDLGLGVFADCDLLLTGLDGRSSRLAVNRIAALLGIDWIDAAVDGSGERLYGTVSWFRPHRDDLACYACPFDGARLAAIAAEEHGAGCASWRSADVPNTPPTLAASSFGAVVAGFQTGWAIQALLGAADPPLGRQLQIAGGSAPRLRSVELTRSPRCTAPHRRLDSLRRSDAATPAALLAHAEAEQGAAPDVLVFPGRWLVDGLACPGCGRERALVARRETVSDAAVRCDCADPTGMLPSALIDRLDAARVRDLGEVGWRALGLPDEDLVTVRTAGRADRHYLLPRAAKESTR